jgi:glutamine phosphoribosylpyrophosphate amidotransferase
MVGVGNRDQRGEMQHRIASLHRGAHSVGVAHISGENLKTSRDVGRAGVEPTPGVERIIEHKGLHLMTVAHQRLDQMGSDEAFRTGD